MADSTTWGAARVATFAALPIAVVVGLATFWWLRDLGTASPARPHPQATTPVRVAAAPLDAKGTAACRDLIAKLPPGKVRDRPRRPVTAGPGQNAAYGDPAITLACGAAPVTLPVGAEVFVLSGVCWFPASDGAASVWTTVDRDVPVRVAVPKSYDAPGQWVIEFSAPIDATLPRSATTPSGC
jgi:hypothetical protein